MKIAKPLWRDRQMDKCQTSTDTEMHTLSSMYSDVLNAIKNSKLQDDFSASLATSLPVQRLSKEKREIS